MSHLSRSLVTTLLAGACLASGGCIFIAAGAGVGTAYALGDESMYSSLDVEQTADAVRKALAAWDATYITTEPRDGNGLRVKGHKTIGGDYEDIDVSIWIPKDSDKTKLSVRIGTIGKKDATVDLMAEIRKQIEAAGGTT